MIRLFEDDKISHVEGNLNIIRDIEIIETELLIHDLDTIEKRIKNAKNCSFRKQGF